MKAYNWEDAIKFAEEMNSKNYLGYNNWRLPTIDELLSLIDRTRFEPALPVEHPFKLSVSSCYWSITSYASYTGFNWIIDMNDGCTYYIDKAYSYRVWLMCDIEEELSVNSLRSRFTEVSEGVILDNKTSLQWVKDLSYGGIE